MYLVVFLGDYLHYIIVDSGCFGNKMLALNLETHLFSVTLFFTITKTSCFLLNKKNKKRYYYNGWIVKICSFFQFKLRGEGTANLTGIRRLIYKDKRSKEREKLNCLDTEHMEMWSVAPIKFVLTRWSFKM